MKKIQLLSVILGWVLILMIPNQPTQATVTTSKTWAYQSVPGGIKQTISENTETTITNNTGVTFTPVECDDLFNKQKTIKWEKYDHIVSSFFPESHFQLITGHEYIVQNNQVVQGKPQVARQYPKKASDDEAPFSILVVLLIIGLIAWGYVSGVNNVSLSRFLIFLALTAIILPINLYFRDPIWNQNHSVEFFLCMLIGIAVPFIGGPFYLLRKRVSSPDSIFFIIVGSVLVMLTYLILMFTLLEYLYSKEVYHLSNLEFFQEPIVRQILILFPSVYLIGIISRIVTLKIKGKKLFA